MELGFKGKDKNRGSNSDIIWNNIVALDPSLLLIIYGRANGTLWIETFIIDNPILYTLQIQKEAVLSYRFPLEK